MDENNNHEHHHHPHEHCPICNNQSFKYIVIGLLVFLGAFVAFYTLADMHIHKMMYRMHPMYKMHKMEKNLMKDAHHFDRIMKRDFEEGKESMKYLFVKKTPEAYQVIINLAPFNMNEKNIEVTTDNNTLTINAAGEKTEKNSEEFVRFNQSFTFPENVELDKLTKIREGHNYIISVPVE